MNILFSDANSDTVIYTRRYGSTQDMFQYIFAGRIQIRRIRNSNVIRIAFYTGGASLALTNKNVT